MVATRRTQATASAAGPTGSADVETTAGPTRRSTKRSTRQKSTNETSVAEPVTESEPAVKATATRSRRGAKENATAAAKPDAVPEVEVEAQSTRQSSRKTRQLAQSTSTQSTTAQNEVEAKPTRTRRTRAAAAAGEVDAADRNEATLAVCETVEVPRTKVKMTRATKTAQVETAVDTKAAVESVKKTTRGKKNAAELGEPNVAEDDVVSVLSKRSTRASKPSTKASSSPPAERSRPNVKAATNRQTKTRQPAPPNHSNLADSDFDASEIIVVRHKTPARMSRRKFDEPEPEPEKEMEMEMSSRATTPDSVQQSFDSTLRPGDAVDEDEVESSSEGVTEDEEETETADFSDDELMIGPTTPMRRASPRTEARFLASAGGQSTVKRSKRANDHLRTPAMLKCPKTPGTTRRVQDQELSFVVDDEVLEGSQIQGIVGLEGDGEDVDMSVSDTQLLVDDSLVDGQNTILTIDDDDEGDDVEDFEDGDVVTDDTVLQHDDTDMHGDSTILDPDTTDAQISAESFDTVVHREAQYPAYAPITPGPPRAQTLIWANVQRDDTIAVDFDSALAAARSTLPEPEPTERMDFVASAMLDHDEMEDSIDELQVDAGRETSRTSRRQTDDATVNFGDFLEPGAFASPTKALPELPVARPVVLSGSTGAGLSLPAAGLTSKCSPVKMAAPSSSTKTTSPQTPSRHGTQPPTAESAETPHYALPTMAFDARRKSLPATVCNPLLRTPVTTAARPSTADAASIARVKQPFGATGQSWWAKSPERKTSFADIAEKEESESSPRRTTLPSPDKTAHSSPVRAEAVETDTTPRRVLRNADRLPPQTVAAPRQVKSILSKDGGRRQTVHKLATGQAAHRVSIQPVSTPAGKTRPDETPQSSPWIRQASSRRRTAVQETPVKPSTPAVITLQARTLGRPTEHARTVAGPVRFQTPDDTPPVKRPDTVGKPLALRTALRSTTVRTPLKPAAEPATPAAPMTPGQMPMTPHPSAPLRGIVAMVEVYTLEGASASAPFVALLLRLGARTAKSFTDRVTHIVYKDGAPGLLQRVRVHNKAISEGEAQGTVVQCVNSRWVTACDEQGMRVDETDEAFAVDVEAATAGAVTGALKRRRKSMEPSALLNINGNIVRSSSGNHFGVAATTPRTSISPRKGAMPLVKENDTLETPKMGAYESGINTSLSESPATPDWIADPSKLVQMTAPQNRVRKLDLAEQPPGRASKGPKDRRLTFWNGTGR